MTNHYEASVHYNGIILLTAYLQRQFVYETVQVRLHNASDERIDQLKGFLDHTHAMLKLFEQTKSLMDNQKDKLKSFADQVTEMMQGYMKAEPTSTERLAIVASTLYAEQMMNDGIIRLGQVFQQDVGKNFGERIKYYTERTKAIDMVVQLLADGKEVGEGMLEQIDKWYENIAVQKEQILADIKKITEMLDY